MRPISKALKSGSEASETPEALKEESFASTRLHLLPNQNLTIVFCTWEYVDMPLVEGEAVCVLEGPRLESFKYQTTTRIHLAKGTALTFILPSARFPSRSIPFLVARSTVVH